jgi:ribosomal protein L11 methyltransferase
MFSLLLQRVPEDRDILVARLWEAGPNGIVESDRALEAFFPDDTQSAHLIEAFGEHAPLWRHVSDVDWVARTRESFPAIPLGERFFLAPPWSDAPTPQGRLRLEINPGMACGTGWHPCTQMCLAAMERYLQPGSSVLDVGAGSGILSKAASLLGAARVVSCDIDPDSAAIASQTLSNPGFVGSADAVCSQSFDLVIANISGEVVTALLADLERARKPNGRLILSGFANRIALPPVLETLQREEWICLVC